MKLSKMLLKELAEFSTEMPDHNLIFLTSAGIVCGKVATDKDLEDTESNVSGISLLCQKVVSEYKEDLGIANESPIPDNEGYIILKDVSLVSGARTTALPFAVLFFGEIIGFSFGKFSSVQ